MSFDITSCTQRDDPFLFLSPSQKVERVKASYERADEYRQCGDYNHLYGYEGSQFCRLLAEFLPGMMTAGSWETIDELAFDLYGRTSEYYPHFLGLLNETDGWHEYITSYVPCE